MGELEDWPALELTMRQNSWATALARSPSGHLLATPDGSDVRLWDALGTGVSQLFDGHTGEVTSVAFSPDGTSLASGSEDCTVRLWNLETGTSEIVIRHTGKVLAVSFSPDGKHVVSGTRGNVWYVYGTW